jgi:Methyltransferase domain
MIIPDGSKAAVTAPATSPPSPPPTIATSATSQPSRRRPKHEFNMEKLRDECLVSTNPLLVDFVSSPLMLLFLEKQSLAARAFGRMNRSRLRKELLESAALESRLQRTFLNIGTRRASHRPEAAIIGSRWGSTGSAARDGFQRESVQGQPDDIVIWDLCCGQGLSSLWLVTNTFGNVTDQKVSIHMTDSNQNINVDWLTDFSNLTFHKLDIYSQELEDAIRDSLVSSPTSDFCSPEKTARLILVGLHTCGDLSRRVLELGQLCGAYVTLVSPCCCIRSVHVNKRRPGSFGYDTAQRARKFQTTTTTTAPVVTVYQLWCWMLWGYAQETAAKAAAASTHGHHRHYINLTPEPLMKTDKNMWLTVIRS